MDLQFTAVTPETLETALDWMNLLYTGAGGVHDRPRARRAMERLLAQPEAGGAWFISADGQVAGYIALTTCFSMEFGGAFALLDELYFAEPFRGRGLGARAVAFAEEWARARSIDALRLEVYPENERAMRLYRRVGFGHARDLMTKWL